MRGDSFLANHNISLSDFILLTCFWAHETSVTATAEMVGLHINTIVQWFSYLRDVTSRSLIQQPLRIGGINCKVEIDESLVARRKYSMGHRVPERWVFGGIDPESNTGFLVMVDDRSSATLLPFIERYIEPGSIVCSDQWAAYNGITNINVIPPYQHLTVNHRQNFVDPITGCTTNHIECMWKNCKKKFKAMNGVHSTMMASHLDEFMWRQRHGKTHADSFNNILNDISPLSKYAC